MLSIEDQLAAARQRLLDLTMRNRLLNYRASKTRSVRVVDESPGEIYDLLVIKGQTLEFRGRPPKALLSSTSDGPFSLGGAEDEGPSTLWKPASEEPLNHPHADRFLETPLEPQALLQRLFYVNQESRSVLEDQGYSVLYMAIGFLLWRESDEAMEMRQAPLILVPVELDRGRGGGYTKIKWTGEEIFSNLSLQAKLAELGVELPPFEMPDENAGVDEYFKRVVEATSSMKGWSLSSDVALDFFSFTKFVMYKDLAPESWPEGMSPGQHPLVREILQPSGLAASGGFSEIDIDEKLKARDVCHVMDADPSQIAVIEDVKAGRNLVVEGPPGTGKSQTIANIIAEALGAEKTVLFVSEKMAALEVVKSRLDKAGLGSFCLELHSRKSSKKQLLQELERCTAGRVNVESAQDEMYDRLDAVKGELNAYARALREPIGGRNYNPFQLVGLKERSRDHFARSGREMPRVSLGDAVGWGRAQWQEAVGALTELVDGLGVSEIDRILVWQHCDVGTILPADEDEIAKALRSCLDAVERLRSSLSRLEPIAGVKAASRLDRVQGAIDAAGVVAHAPKTDRDVLQSDAWNQPNKEAEELVRQVSRYQVSLRSANETFEASALEVDSEEFLNSLRLESSKFLHALRSRYRALRRAVMSLYRQTPPTRAIELIAGLEKLDECRRRRVEVQRAKETGTSLFGSLWQGGDSDADALRRFAEWAVSFRGHLMTETLAATAVDLVCEGVSRQEIKDVVADAAKALADLRASLSILHGILNPAYFQIFGKELESAGLADLSKLVEAWLAGARYLQKWAQLNARRKACLSTVAASLVPELDRRTLAPADAQACLEGNYADELLRAALTSRPSLGQFFGELHEKKIERFDELDREIIRQNRRRLVRRLDGLRPRIAGGASPASEAGILLGEFNRKRGHMSIRKLMARVGGLIQKIKPCFMMSPLSIAQFLDPHTSRFDLIVFDEASQVRPQDALGALLRGRQVVVMGDTQQLPPTRFFDAVVEGDGEENETDGTAIVADVESILHQCKRSFPEKPLNWHYRSRHESLIAVSNQEFYENKLRVYPSPAYMTKDLGLQFSYLPKTVYDRGRSSMNREEARAVARAAAEHYRSHPEKSLGVGAFNIKQQQAILEEIEMQIRQHPDLEPNFSSTQPEHFFVKNLETIQGDERDVILLSIGFGFDAAGRLNLNFGPLNQEGGERRLNVLISRARERCVVFANFRASDLALEPTSPFGLRALKVFLEYAETRELKDEDVSREDTDSPFEDSVFEVLRSRGHEVRKQVGCAGFRVDLAVVDPRAPGRYLLGIECDGAKYHETPVARDRDRLRQQILEQLGWSIYRVWSTDWYRNRVDAEQHLLAAVERARSTLPPPPPPAHRTETPVPALNVPEEVDDQGAPRLQVPAYRACESLGISVRGQLHEQSPFILAKAVAQVVGAEAPVHIDEVIRRIRKLWGLERAGNRIRSAIQRAVHIAERGGDVSRRGDFLWVPNRAAISPRRRVDDPPPKIELICDEEIAAAIFLVLNVQYATPVEELITQTARVFGIQATSAQTATRIRAVIDQLTAKDILRTQPNGMLQRAEAQT